MPMSIPIKLDKDEHGEKVDEQIYRDVIGSLLYFTVSRPDIILIVGFMLVFSYS